MIITFSRALMLLQASKAILNSLTMVCVPLIFFHSELQVEYSLGDHHSASLLYSYLLPRPPTIP